jgi:hypothetical protein
MIEQDLVWAMLPEGLGNFFEIERYEKDDKVFRIVLMEKNIVPTLPEEYRGKKVINTVMKSFTVDFFPIKGRKGELILKRRLWQFEEIDKLFKREIDLCVPGTHLEKEFASFLKELDRECAGGNQPSGQGEQAASANA